MFKSILFALIVMGTTMTGGCEKENLNWFIGKTYTSNAPISPNPELGGADFVTFRDASHADLKGGDIIEPMTYSIEGVNLTLTGMQTQRKTTLKLDNDQKLFTDAFGHKWLEKK